MPCRQLPSRPPFRSRKQPMYPTPCQSSGRATTPVKSCSRNAQVLVARCTFPPGAMHVCHSHPSYLSYVVSGGQAQIQDEKGVRKVNVVAGALADVPPTPWHELTNVGDTTLQFVVVEKKYQAGPKVD